MPPKLATLKDLNKDEPDDDENRLFAGGLDGRGGGSGLSVLGPPGGPKSPAAGAAAGSGGVFGEIKAQAEQASGDALSGERVYTVTKYRNGFTINDGALLDSESAEGHNFFKRLLLRQIPREIEELEAAAGRPLGESGATVAVVDKQNEDWEPKMDSKSLFKRGGGAQIGKAEDCGADAHCLLFTEATTSAASAGPVPVLDAAQPTTQLAVKGPDGKTLKFKVNSGLPVAQLGAVLVQQLGLPHGGDKGFTVSSGFPAKCVEASDAAKSLLEAGLTNTQITQKFK